MRYFTYLIVYLMIQVLTWIITPLLPLFKESRWGLIDNASRAGIEPRLPLWLSWFDTPDNSLLGDNNWVKSHTKATYWTMVAWLYRNSLYGFKWSVLAAPAGLQKEFDGNRSINYIGPVFGALRVKAGRYWQWKKVIQINDAWCAVLNFGWLLDDDGAGRPLFMFSPRLKRIIFS